MFKKMTKYLIRYKFQGSVQQKISGVIRRESPTEIVVVSKSGNLKKILVLEKKYIKDFAEVLNDQKTLDKIYQ